jgi:hypothetical protein
MFEIGETTLSPMIDSEGESPHTGTGREMYTPG